ncbi:MAG: ferredoxin [Planctomycetota bacterium]
MANPKNKVAKNVAGKWYVDVDCIDCDLCRTTAPKHFRANEDDGYSYVFLQPTTDEERAICQQALEECPVEAIGSDGGA